MPASDRKIIPCLAVSHTDFQAAKRWLMWASFLAKQKGGDVAEHTLVVFYTKRAAEGIESLRKAILPSRRWFHTIFVECPDENEDGYPQSANHLFLRALEHCRKEYPKFSTLFIEPDCVPVAPTWFDDVCAEYNSHSKTFMGALVESGINHMTGNAIYGADWPKKAPSIKNVLMRKDSGGMFPDGRGYPFDLYIAPETTADMHASETIFQLWYPGVWSFENLHRIPTQAKLVHQDKEGTLILTLARTRYPEFLDNLPQPSCYFSYQNPSSIFKLGHFTFNFIPCAKTPGGGWWSVYKPLNAEEEMLLSSVAGKLGIALISADDYKKFLAQRRP